MYNNRITIQRLRQDFPTWSWLVVRRGFAGWEYRGTKNAKVLRVYAVGVLCGPAEDDFDTQWRVDDGKTSKQYTSWYLEQT